jgi:hypothetical protein
MYQYPIIGPPSYVASSVYHESLLTVLISLYNHGDVKLVSLVKSSTGFVKYVSGHSRVSKE